MMKNLRGVTGVKVQGSKLYKFINAVRENGIVCTSQYCKDQYFYGQVYTRDLEKIKNLAKYFGLEIEITNKIGMRYKIFRYRWRIGILLGIMVLFGFVFYISNTVVTIEVCGNSSITDTQIINALAETGIYKGKFIADINFWESEKKLRLSIPGIAWTGIRHTGSRVVVDITEVTPKPEMILDDIPCNIVSTKNAQITSVIVNRGQLVKAKGEAVKKGDIIISGVIEDSKGKIIKRHAMGEITGVYNEEMKFTQYFSENNAVYTGNDVTQKYIDFFSMRVPISWEDTDFDTYDYNENTNYFMIFGHEIPIGIIHASYSPFEYKQVNFTSEEANQKLEQKMALYEKNFYDSCEISILDRKIEISQDSEKTEYTVNYTLEGNIGMDQEFFVKN